MASNLKQQPQPPSSPSPSSSSSSHLQSLSLPFKTRVALKLLDLATDAVRRSNGTVNRPIFNFLDRRVPANPTPLNSVSSHDVIVDPSSNLWFRLFLPHPAAADGGAAGTPIPVIVFFHGGGFVFLSASSFAYDAVCRRLSRRLNAVVCSVEYRLAPEHKFPTQYEDGLAVLKFLDTRRGEIPVWPANAAVSRCFIAGDSAGGNISHHVTVSACTPTSGLTELKVIGLINIQPFFGGLNRVASETDLEGAPIVSAARTAWMWSAFLPEELDADHWAVNVSGPNAVDLKTVEFPETLLFIGGFDPLKDWQRRYYEWLTTSEGKVVKLVEYSNAIHAFYVFPELPQANLLFVEVQEFVRNTLSKLYFLVALSVAGLYSIITLITSLSFLSKPNFPTKIFLILAVHDVLILGIVASATGTAGGVGYIGLKGNSHVNWGKICNVYDKFCRYLGTSILFSLFAAIVLVVLVILNTWSLYKRVPSN